MEMKDSIVEEVRQDLLDRSLVGIKKYETTLDRDDLDLFDWMEHTRQELLDGALYLTRAKKDVENMIVLYDELDDINADLNAELHIKNKIIENLTKVIKSQEDEIAELKKANYNQDKRRNWHY
jgi:hypothetical protein